MQNKNIAELKRKITLVRSADFMLNGFLIMGLIATESSWQILLVIGLFFVQGISYFITSKSLAKDLQTLQNNK